MTDPDRQGCDSTHIYRTLSADDSVRTLEPRPKIAADRRRPEVRLLSLLAVAYTLVLAQTLLVPIALACLLSLVLAPPVRWLTCLHVPRPLGAAAVVLLLLAGLNYGLARSVDPVSAWFEQVPQVLEQLELKLYPIKKTVAEVNKAAEKVDDIASVEPNRSIEVGSGNFSKMLYSNAQGLITGTVTTILLLYFVLSWGQSMLLRIGQLQKSPGRRSRFIELSVILEAELSRYLFSITLINAGLGIAVAGTLSLLGMPNPLLWGAVAALLNYVPYLGGLTTAILLGATALLSFDSLAPSALVVSAFGILTLLEGQIVTPMVLGQRLSLNPLAVFLSVLIWFWMWGVAGALMAVPMLIILKLVGDRVDALRPFAAIAGR